MDMGKFFLLIIAIILGIVFAIVALLGLFRRFLLGFIPKSKQSIKKDESVIYDDGKTTVHSLRSNDRTKK
jgi:flagellar basal body-associated protein FliL